MHAHGREFLRFSVMSFSGKKFWRFGGSFGLTFGGLHPPGIFELRRVGLRNFRRKASPKITWEIRTGKGVDNVSVHGNVAMSEAMR